MNTRSEAFQENITWGVEPKRFEDLSPVEQLQDLKPKYIFEKAAITLQNSKVLLKNLNKVLCFLKSNKEYLVFDPINGASETFFVELLKDKNNLLSNFLDEECRAICQAIYDYLIANDDKFEVFSGFREQEDSKEMTLMYYKNFKFISDSKNISDEIKLEKLKTSKPHKMSPYQKKIQKKCDTIALLSREFIQTTINTTLHFIKDNMQASVIFKDLEPEQFHFVNCITAKKWMNKLGRILEPELSSQVNTISNFLKSKRNWTLNVVQGKLKENSLRDVVFKKIPNFGRDTFREANMLDVLSEDVLNKQKPKHDKLMVDLSTPVVSDNALKIMKCMGWEGGALGIRGNGITEPIMPNINRLKRSGLGHDTTPKLTIKKYVPTNFLITTFEKILILITKGGDELNLASETKMHRKEVAYFSEVIIKLNKRYDTAVGDYGDKYTVMKILEVMVQQPDLRLIVHLYSDKNIKIIKSTNLQSIPEYIQGTDINQYVNTLIRSFGPVFVVDLTRKSHLYTVLTLLLDLVVNKCESKTYISPICFTKKETKSVLTLVNHVNVRKKYGSGKIEQLLFDRVLQNVKGFFLQVDFDLVRSQSVPSKPNDLISKNSFTIRKIYNKHIGIYKNMLTIVHDESKPNIESNKESMVVDEKCHQNLTADDISDGSTSMYDITDDELESYDDDIIDKTHAKSTRKVTLDDDGRNINDGNELGEATLSNNVSVRDTNTVEVADVSDKLLQAPTSSGNSTVVENLNIDTTPMHSIISETSTNVEKICNSQKDVNPQTSKELVIDDKTYNTSPMKCKCKLRSDEYNGINKETQTTSLPGDDDEFKDANMYDFEDRPSTSKSDFNTDSMEFSESVNMYDNMYEDFDEFQDVDSEPITPCTEKTKFNSPDEWEQLEKDIFNLRTVLENEFMNSVMNKSDSAEANFNNLKRYKFDLEKFGSPTENYLMKTVKIVPLNYPNEVIDKKTILKIQSLIMDAVTETEQPLLKCHGVKDGALLYTCYTQDGYKFLNKLLIHTKTKIVYDALIQRKPRLFMRCINYLELTAKDIFSKLELFNKNKGVNTKEWEVERYWDNNDFSLFVLQVDQVSFELIKNNGFCLFFGVDQAEFSIVWR